MKKVMAVILIVAAIVGVCGCGKENSSADNNAMQESMGKKTETENVQNMEMLKMLTNDSPYAYCYTTDGYYYITEEGVELEDGSYGSHIMYMDFATQKEVYLCSDAGCNHLDKSCSAVMGEDEYLSMAGRMFVWNNKLYILNKQCDEDGSVGINLMDGQMSVPESRPAVLYQMELDGTNRKKVYTFEDNVTLEDVVLAAHEQLYFVVKKLETTIDGAASVTTATERNLVSLDFKNKTLENVMSLDMEDGILWKITGCYDNSLVLEGTAYENGDSGSVDMSEAQWKELYNKSVSIFATLDLDKKELKQVYQIQNTGVHSSANKDGRLYLSDDSSENIVVLDLRSATMETAGSLEQNNIVGTLSDRLICRTWDMSEDDTMYFVNMADGSVSHCELTNRYNGWALEIMAETQKDALVIYDYKADKNPDDSYEIYQYKYALISKEDLYAGKESFRPVEMCGKGR